MPHFSSCPAPDEPVETVVWVSDRWQGGGSRFPATYKPPRTCRYCGGAHPDDVLDLLRHGWEVEGSSVPHKKYIHPPGFSAKVAAELEMPRPASRVPVPRGYEDAAPFVKLYSFHLTPEQQRDFNTLILATKQV